MWITEEHIYLEYKWKAMRRADGGPLTWPPLQAKVSIAYPELHLINMSGGVSWFGRMYILNLKAMKWDYIIDIRWAIRYGGT